MSAYITNKDPLLNKKAMKPQFLILKIFGFNFYEDILFTSKRFCFRKPKTCKRFYNATMERLEICL